MQTRRNTILGCLCAALVFLGAGPGPATAGDAPALQMAPAALDGLSADQLNEFGEQLLNEIYSTHALIARSAKDGVLPTPDKVDPAVLKQIKDLYDDDALIQRARLNHGLTKATFFPHYIDTFTLSDVVAKRSGKEAMVMTYNVALPNRTTLRAGAVMSGESQPRIAVLRWREAEGMWKIFSYADFDVPRAMLCEADKSYVSPKSEFKPEDLALGKELLDRIQEASLTGTEKSVQTEGFQYVFASGERKTGGDTVRARIKKHFEPRNIEAIRSGDLLVVRSDTDDPTLTIDGEGIVPEMRPGITTFRRDADGQWRMIAIGIFAITAKVAKGTPCEPAPAAQ